MHYSAKLGLAIVRTSVCPYVTLVDCDHIGWNSSKIISLLVSVGRSLSADPNIMDLLQGEQPEMFAQSDPPPAGVPRRQPHRRSGLATLPLWEPSPSHPILL